MSQVTVKLDDVVIYVRELLAMSKAELFREAGQDRDKIKKPDMILHALERRFDPTARTGLDSMAIDRRRKDPYNPHFGRKRRPSLL